MYTENQEGTIQKETIGLIPAAGFARRISPLPCSKEIYPINDKELSNGEMAKLRVISSYLLESLQIAGIEQAYMVLRDGKWDIPAYLYKQDLIKIALAYLVVGATPGVPYTIDSAYSFVKNKNIVFGFPDIIFKPRDAFVSLLGKRQESKADVVLGLFKADDTTKMDMVELGEKDEVRKIIIKPEKTHLTFTWIIAVWNVTFTDFMHHFLSKQRNKNSRIENKEIHLGEVIQKAISAGLTVSSVKFSDGFYLDIGTPEDLKKTVEIGKV